MLVCQHRQGIQSAWMMTNLSNRSSLFLLFVMLMFCTESLFGQNRNSKCYSERLIQGVWAPLDLSDGKLKVLDTLKREVQLVFELKFDDSICIVMNSAKLYEKRIKTSRAVSVVEDEFIVDYSGSDTIPFVQIVLVDKKKCIQFRPLLGYRFVYIVRDEKEGVWGFQYSNYYRDYR